MNKCFITISNPAANCQDYKEFDSLVEQILKNQYGEKFIFDLDLWWRQSSLDYRARNYPLNLHIWDNKTKSTTSIWETPDSIEHFVEYFFGHPMFLKFKNALESQGWKVKGPELE